MSKIWVCIIPCRQHIRLCSAEFFADQKTKLCSDDRCLVAYKLLFAHLSGSSLSLRYCRRTTCRDFCRFGMLHFAVEIQARSFKYPGGCSPCSYSGLHLFTDRVRHNYLCIANHFLIALQPQIFKSIKPSNLQIFKSFESSNPQSRKPSGQTLESLKSFKLSNPQILKSSNLSNSIVQH